jgi:cyclin-D1-binding protein 1
LALDPKEPTFSAAISPLDDLVKHINALASCASLFTATFGSTLRTEVVGLALDVLQATRGFVNHCALITGGATPLSKLKATHLYLTGSLHELIDHSRGSDELSKDNLQAVRKKWLQDRSVLDDGYRELSELLTSIEADNDSFNDEDLDGQDCLVLESVPLTTEETERVKKVRISTSRSRYLKLSGTQVQRYIRITNLFHERVCVDLLKPSALEVTSPPNFISTLDKISHQSTQFVSITDEIISCLHSPQDPKAISTSLQSLREVVVALQQLLIQSNLLSKPKEQCLESQIESRTVGGSKAGQKKVKDTRKWFDTCIDQVDKLQVSLSAEFNR